MNTFASLVETVAGMRDKLLVAASNHARAARDAATANEKLDSVREDFSAVSAAHAVIIGEAQAAQSEVQSLVSTIVTRCLTMVMPDKPHRFEVRFVPRRGKTEADFILFTGEHETQVTTSSMVAGGVKDVISFGLRLAALLLSKRDRRVLIADEPFKNVSECYLPNVVQMVHALATDLGVQFILVTHIHTLIEAFGESGSCITIGESP